MRNTDLTGFDAFYHTLLTPATRPQDFLNTLVFVLQWDMTTWPLTTA